MGDPIEDFKELAPQLSGSDNRYLENEKFLG